MRENILAYLICGEVLLVLALSKAKHNYHPSTWVPTTVAAIFFVVVWPVWPILVVAHMIKR